MTDYTDEELKGRELEEIRDHLAECAECRELAEEAESASCFVKTMPKIDTPSFVWDKIKAEIEARGAAAPSGAHKRLWHAVRPALSMPAGMFAMATAAALIIAVIIFGQIYARGASPSDDQLIPYAVLGYWVEDENMYAVDNMQTSPEEYFL